MGEKRLTCKPQLANMRQMKPKPCKRCNGTGVEPDHSITGSAMRAKRVAAGVSLRKLAIALGLSAPYLSDLELGHRAWSAQRVKDFTKTLKTLDPNQKTK